MAPPKKTAPVAARVPGRDEAAARVPERDDPNVIKTRDGKIVDLSRVRNQSIDRLDLAAMGIFPPPGWTYEWRTKMVKNAPWTQAVVDDAQAGWTAVPASRHPGLIMPLHYEGPIEYNGLVLMERDERLTAMSRRAQKAEADDNLNISRSMTGLMQRAAPNSGAIADFEVGAARGATGVRIDRTPRVNDSKYTYAIDE